MKTPALSSLTIDCLAPWLTSFKCQEPMPETPSALPAIVCRTVFFKAKSVLRKSQEKLSYPWRLGLPFAAR